MTSTMRPTADRVAVGHLRDLRGDHLAARRAAGVALRNLHVGQQTPIERHDEPEAAVVDVVASDDALRRALEDAQDPPFGLVAVAAVLDAHDDPVAVHRLVEVAAGDVDAAGLVLPRRLRLDEREPARVGRDAPDHEVHQIRQPQAVAANLDERARRHQRPETAADGRALLARHPEAPQQLRHRRRMVDVLADLPEQQVVRRHSVHDISFRVRAPSAQASSPKPQATSPAVRRTNRAPVPMSTVPSDGRRRQLLPDTGRPQREGASPRPGGDRRPGHRRGAGARGGCARGGPRRVRRARDAPRTGGAADGDGGARRPRGCRRRRAGRVHRRLAEAPGLPGRRDVPDVAADDRLAQVAGPPPAAAARRG